MQSPCTKEASKACLHGCCPAPFLGSPQPSTPKSTTTAQFDFIAATASSLHPHTKFTDHESLPPLSESISNFIKSYPQFPHTNQADRIRAQHYTHLSPSSRVCLDYSSGHGLFSFSQQQIASSNVPFFDIIHKSVNLNSHILYGSEESEFESRMRKRITGFMNISEDDYSMVFTANKSSAFKLLSESYPFHSNPNLVTVYDHENEAVEGMIKSSRKRGTRVRSAEFSWPNLRIQTRKLKKMILSKRKKRERGLFVFPLQSGITGTRYPYLWMSIAQENGWHVLLDASALGAKDMDTLGLSLFRPDFLICSFFKVFGDNPSGFGCLFIKKSSVCLLSDSGTGTSIGIVRLVPGQTRQIEDLPGPSSRNRDENSEIEEVDEALDPTRSKCDKIYIDRSQGLECRGLDNADSLGLVLISTRTRCLVNWLVNALMSLKHPNSENGLFLTRIYGPKIRIDRGPAVAFNVFDWKGEKIDPQLVQKLADRKDISLGCGFLRHIWFSDKYKEEKELLLDRRREGKERSDKESCHRGMYVLTASLGFLTSFEDVYRLWAFISRFLDADFVEKERWRYLALNQKMVEV